MKKSLLVTALVVVFLILAGYVIYELILMGPKITLAYPGKIGQQKLDTEFKVAVELENLAVLSREYMINLDIFSGTQIKMSLPAQVKKLEPRKKQTVEFTCILSEPLLPGPYSSVIYVTTKRSMFSSAYSRIAESSQEFLLAEKIISGIVNFIDIKGGRKVGEVMTVNAVAKNTGEAAKVFSLDCEIINPKGEAVRFPAKDFSLNMEESRKISYEHNVPLKAPGGKYKIKLSLYAGAGADKAKKLMAEQELEKNILERTVKASVEAVKLSGKLKSGETVNFEINVKNTGDIEKLFSLEVSLLDPSGKLITLPSKELQTAAGEIKKYSSAYPIPRKDSHGLYKISIIVFAGSSHEPARKKLTEAHQEFSVAERVTKAAVTKVVIAASKTKIKVGEPVTITVGLMNTGETEHAFPVTIVINGGNNRAKLDAKLLSLGVGEEKQIVFEYLIPLAGTGGSYGAKAGVYNSIDAAGNIIELFEEKSSAFTVGGPNILGTAELAVISGKIRYGDTVNLKAKFLNTGEVRHVYFVKIEVLDPLKKISTIINEKVDLDRAGQVEKTGEFKIDPALAEGKYTVLASLWERLGEDGNPAGKLGEDSHAFEVLDTAPVITNIIGVAPVIGRNTTIVATVKDDKEIKAVMLVYIGPGMSETAKDIMTRTSGNKKDGSYSAQTRRFNYAGSLKYYVEATDSKGQKSRSPESNTQIK